MATTTKTLTPTNQTITIPDMTERPNVSLLTDGIGKEADAINTLNSNLSIREYKSKNVAMAANESITITCTSLFVVGVKNATSDQIMGDAIFGNYLGDSLRLFKLTDNGTFTISYSGGVATITNNAGMYQGFMILYK